MNFLKSNLFVSACSGHLAMKKAGAIPAFFDSSPIQTRLTLD
jgi:hypothetical protein